MIYNVVVGPHAPGRPNRFTTGPAIRQAIGKMDLEVPHSIGHIMVRAQSGEAGTHLQMVNFYPFSEKLAHKHLRGKGVASLIELAVEGDLMKRFLAR